MRVAVGLVVSRKIKQDFATSAWCFHMLYGFDDVIYTIIGIYIGFKRLFGQQGQYFRYDGASLLFGQVGHPGTEPEALYCQVFEDEQAAVERNRL